MADDTHDSYSVIKDLKYYDCENENTEIISKNKLDLFLPKDSDENTPLLVFVHGGGWMRGDRRAYRHFVSIYNVNLLVALVMVYYDAYTNVGRHFASNGVACAVVSYRLSSFEFPWFMIEVLCPLLFSVIITLTPLTCLLLLLRSVIQLDYLIGMDFSVIFPTLVVASLLIVWAIVCYFDRSYIISKYERIWPIIMSIIMTFLTPLPYLTLWSMVWLGIFLLLTLITLHQIREPGAKHPAHISDVARSVACLKDLAVKTKTFSHNLIFLCGHSAGGHLVSLLALDSSYLEKAGLCLKDIKGVISISGVYDLHKLSGGITEHLFLRPAFGENENVWTSASPSHHLTKQAPKKTSGIKNCKIPFLIINANVDPLLKADACQFVEKLIEQNFSCKHVVVPNVNHLSIILKFGSSNGLSDSTELHCLSFIKRNIERIKLK